MQDIYGHELYVKKFRTWILEKLRFHILKKVKILSLQKEPSKKSEQ